MNFIKTLVSFLLDKQYRDLLITTTLVLTLGTVFYHFVENWTWIDSIYFSVTTLTTVGLGDLSPQSDIGKIFTIFYIIVGIGIILTFINTIYEHYSQKFKRKN